MKNFIKKFLILPLFLLLSPLFGQQFGMGAILDPEIYEQTEAKPVLVTRNYNSLPRSVSLKQYCPVPGNQGRYYTCVGWATAYAARTISESVTLNRINQTEILNNVFSPNFVYIGHYLLMGIKPNGYEGAHIFKVLDYMRDTGAVRMLAFERTTPFYLIDFSAYNNSSRYKIANFVRLFSNPRGVPGTEDERVPPVKKSLSERKPVIIAMNTPPSFVNFGTAVWRPNEDPNVRYEGHAMCVVGYDDDMYGGAFEVLNSWDTIWANRGYVWIRYSDFAAYVNQAYEIIENLTLFRDAAQFAASIKIDVFNDSRGMPVTYDNEGFYRTRFSYPLGTLFQFQMTNRYPAHVYAFSADDSSSDIERIFPMPGVSPVLDYVDSTVAWPGENEAMEIASTAGTHYLVVLYSKEALDIEAIERRFAAERGTFPERVASAVEAVVGTNNFIPYRDVQYNSSEINFSAESTNPSAVFGLLLAIDHRAR